MDIFATSDHHFGHPGIIRTCNRPFSSVEEMDEVMIQNWNAEVHKKATVLYLGDLYLGKDPLRALNIFNRLNGRKILIIGNHDKGPVLRLPWAEPPAYMQVFKHDRMTYVLNHYAMRTWPSVRRGSIHLYGHAHGTMPPVGRSVDVGVDAWNFKPVHIDTLRQMMENVPIYSDEMASDVFDEPRELTP